jgi:periplasmic divalent cation tolerance protein
MEEIIQVFTTTEKKEDAERIARALIDGKLAACVQIMGPMESTYRWQGRIEKSVEWFCFIKTTQDAYPELEKTIKENHPYEVPEIIAVPVSGGSADYLAWLKGQVGKAET